MMDPAFEKRIYKYDPVDQRLITEALSMIRNKKRLPKSLGQIWEEIIEKRGGSELTSILEEMINL